MQCYVIRRVKLVYEDPIARESQEFAFPVRFGRSRSQTEVALRCRTDPRDPGSEENKEASLRISRCHLEFVLTEGRPAVINRGSPRITMLNAELLAGPEPKAIADGDIVKIGDLIGFRVKLDAGLVRLTREEPPGAAPVTIESDIKPDLVEYSRSMETSILVIMFTDQVGSTNMADAIGEQAFHKVRRARDKIQSDIVVRRSAGRMVKSTGDGMLCVFQEPKTAIDRAVEIQRSLHAYNADKPAEQHLKMRIGLDMGQVVIDRQLSFDVFGMHVNRAARVMSEADAGEIYLSSSVYDTAKGWTSDADYTITSLGSRKLKGISGEEVLYKVEFKP